MRLPAASLMLILAVGNISFAPLDDKVADRLWESSKVVDESVKGADSDIPKDLLKKASCVAIIPAVKKAAFCFGGHYGRGTVSCRKDEGKGEFGAPSMLKIEGGSFGFQIGGESVDVVMLFMSPKSMESLLKDKVTLGGDVSAAAGPIGRQASAETNALMTAEILTYAKSKGLFAGLSLKGSSLRPDNDANESLYGRKIPAKEILIENKVPSPQVAQKLIDSLTKAVAN